MRKVSHEWQKYLKKGYINGKYWDDFKENALAASVEIKEINRYEEALPIIEDIIASVKAQSLAAVDGTESDDVSRIYKALSENHTVYTDKFEIAKNAPTVDIGISTGEFGVGETGSICVDNYSYEARVTTMLPPINIVFMNKNYIVNNMTDAFAVLEKVFDKGYTGFVTGPSRTSDIERVLTLGVHGPSRLILLAVDERQ